MVLISWPQPVAVLSTHLRMPAHTGLPITFLLKTGLASCRPPIAANWLLSLGGKLPHRAASLAMGERPGPQTTSLSETGRPRLFPPMVQSSPRLEADINRVLFICGPHDRLCLFRMRMDA